MDFSVFKIQNPWSPLLLTGAIKALPNPTQQPPTNALQDPFMLSHPLTS